MAEHYVTLFYANFLLQGVSMLRSITRHEPEAKLWVICMDDACEQHLRRLSLPNVTAVPLHEAENEALRSVKAGRSRAEYCWTMSPFSPGIVFARDSAARRATYVDADVFFFKRPSILIDELVQSGKDLMVTEHAYAPEYDQAETIGRFCVQFMPFNNSEGGRRVLRWWQERCIEWCFATPEPGRCGDQKYLDAWPDLFAAETHILQRPDLTLAPWNVDMFARGLAGGLDPVLYHFQGLRVVKSGVVRLHAGHRVGRSARPLYASYMEALRDSARLLREHDLDLPVIPEPAESLQWLRRLKRRLWGEVRYAKLTV